MSHHWLGGVRCGCVHIGLLGSALTTNQLSRYPLLFSVYSSQASVDNRLGAVYVAAVSSGYNIDGLVKAVVVEAQHTAVLADALHYISCQVINKPARWR